MGQTAYPRLTAPWRLGALQLPHRVVMGSMHLGREGEPDALAAFYRERAAGGAALMVTGGLAVSAEGRGGPDYVVLTDGEVAAGMARVVTAVHGAGGYLSAQLFHAGRYAVGDWAVAPSPVPWAAARGVVPREMSKVQVEQTIRDFAAAAATARDAGFDAVEIMASEGYLLNQFLSPVSNQRTDEWGGDAQARMRFPLAVFAAVRAAVGTEFPIVVRVSADDLMPGSSTAAEIDAFAVALATAGVDGIGMGVGWHESSVPTVQAAVPHAAWLAAGERVADAVHTVRPDLPVIASNRITGFAEAESVLVRGHVDAVAMARPFLADSALVARSLAGDADLVNPCIGCNQACIDHSLRFTPVSCLVNPRAGNELELPSASGPGCDGAEAGGNRGGGDNRGEGGGADCRPTPETRNIAVVGGGPAGLAAAEDLLARGHHVTVFESDDRLGGQFLLAARVPGKEDYGRFVAAAVRRLAVSTARIVMGTQPSADDLGDFDGVVLATGVVPRRVDLPRADGSAGAHGSPALGPATGAAGYPTTLGYEEALRNGVPVGPVAIIGGGGIGIDVAAYLTEEADPAARAHEFADVFDVEATPLVASEQCRAGDPSGPRSGGLVTIMRRHGKFGKGTGVTTRWVNVGAVKRAGVQMLTDLDYSAITSGGVVITRTDEGEDAGDGAHATRADDAALARDVTETVPAASVVVCAGQEPNDPLSAKLARLGVPFELAGGARDASGVNAFRARTEGLHAARRLAP